jgi:nucleotide-binding universal stress UspA family protein
VVNDNDVERSKSMFKRILVPLDGSPRAECAIPVAARLARASGGSITFLRVVSTTINAAWFAMESPLLMQETFEVYRAKATDYLTAIAQSPDLTRVEISLEVLAGGPAQAILSAVDSNKVDLIIICSHGDTGLKRWVLGSVAQKVARYSPVPVLVLREGGSLPADSSKRDVHPLQVLVPLDGSSLAEMALTPAGQLSAALSAPAHGALHLVRVLHLPSMYEYGQEDSLAEAKKQSMLQAHAYLGAVEQHLREGSLAGLKLQVTSSVVVDTDVASTLIGVAEVSEDMEDIEGFKACDAIAMATHGRSGPKRWMMGSVTERILGTTKLPLLIVRPQKTDAETEKASEKAGTGAVGQSWVSLL